MKKQVLSAWVFCSALGIAQAQIDVTQEYLVNPSFETLKAADGATDVKVKTSLEKGLQGWEVASMSNYQVESEESGSSTGRRFRQNQTDRRYLLLLQPPRMEQQGY